MVHAGLVPNITSGVAAGGLAWSMTPVQSAVDPSSRLLLHQSPGMMMHHHHHFGGDTSPVPAMPAVSRQTLVSPRASPLIASSGQGRAPIIMSSATQHRGVLPTTTTTYAAAPMVFTAPWATPHAVALAVGPRSAALSSTTSPSAAFAVGASATATSGGHCAQVNSTAVQMQSSNSLLRHGPSQSTQEVPDLALPDLRNWQHRPLQTSSTQSSSVANSVDGSLREAQSQPGRHAAAPILQKSLPAAAGVNAVCAVPSTSSPPTRTTAAVNRTAAYPTSSAAAMKVASVPTTKGVSPRAWWEVLRQSRRNRRKFGAQEMGTDHVSEAANSK